ncbi:D-alanyl-D-alanine carboxypeptidase/D-alanyl-D-alanine endopeptidase [Geminocystis herdmanii]|uniref:D-alanyl-D-alanine carboxypeptidase/D-alanyl-D-alanine endopeptidase n=1 Tax=Geminocystis herdmanii TaxID=669359 RepID=UPI00034977D6|nr:D-alanyl-D-alanine carboxypeptidase/D-alanyl-D-alanine-endopeptidase [Geminocystis herdmanii]
MLKKPQFICSLSLLTLLLSVSPVRSQGVEPTLTDYNYNQDFISIPIEVQPPENKPSTTNACSPFVAPAMEAIIKRYGGGWGILVQKLSDGETIYNYNADRGFIPASNMKILTTAAALQRLSPSTTISANKSLQEWVAVTNLRSDNYYADTLLKRIGGGAVAKQILAQLGINPQGFHFADGSGLSRRNLATPRVLVDTLRVMYSNPQREIFFASLPTAGISGTLRNRMKQTPVQGLVHAKTGTLTGVRALSGYLDHSQYGTLVFSIIANHPNQSGTALVRAIDEMVITLNTTANCQY